MLKLNVVFYDLENPLKHEKFLRETYIPRLMSIPAVKDIQFFLLTSFFDPNQESKYSIQVEVYYHSDEEFYESLSHPLAKEIVSDFLNLSANHSTIQIAKLLD
ncbi:hypothetical protein [Thermoflavimicrobium daqui]|uniref:EthD domain-containing protein n=1 Tax=Thermoflavimicrobium daqui TaxID=2137476 RepID=A0A364K113_9BACL|nr:hypothetical protein [Thermoflavimicrobium daqui]RAL21374.1 hypothetical protein DL897_16680 [Thermoflavimicrobium daqui]